MSIETKARAEYVLFNGLSSCAAGSQKTSPVVNLEGFSNFAIFILSQQAGAWVVEAKVGGQWIPVSNGAYVLGTPLLIAMEEELPAAIRVKITQAVAGHILVTLRPQPSRMEEYDTADLPTLAWITGLGALPNLTFAAIGPVGSVVTANMGTGWPTQGAASTIDEADTLMGVQIPVLGLLADAADLAGGVSSQNAKLRGLVQILSDVWDNANNRLNTHVVSPAPTPGVSEFVPVSGVSNNSTDHVAGEFEFTCSCDVMIRFNPAGDNTAAVWATSPCIRLNSGVTRTFKLGAAWRLTAITTGGAVGDLEILPVTYA